MKKGIGYESGVLVKMARQGTGPAKKAVTKRGR
jgi:hypothetical protein